MEENKLYNEFKINSEHHQAALCTYGKGDKYERRFRRKLSIIKCKIKRINPNFAFEPIKEKINIDYTLFDQNIMELMHKDYYALTRIEFNFVYHYCTGQMIQIHMATQVDLENLKNLFLISYESNYKALKRIAIINDIIHS